MKTFLYGAVLLAMAATAASAADRRMEPHVRPAAVPLSYTPVPVMPLPAPVLPRGHANHCAVHDGRVICAGHCGAGYQVYYCPASATGCCHAGLGYCDASGRLRCDLPWF